MKLWQVCAALRSSKDILLNSNSLDGVVIAVLGMYSTRGNLVRPERDRFFIRWLCPVEPFNVRQGTAVWTVLAFVNRRSPHGLQSLPRTRWSGRATAGFDDANMCSNSERATLSLPGARSLAENAGGPDVTI